MGQLKEERAVVIVITTLITSVQMPFEIQLCKKPSWFRLVGSEKKNLFFSYQ